MIDPDRVLRLVYLPGEKVRVELGFRWEVEVSAVSGHFRRFVGSRYSARHLEPGISLVGKDPRRAVEGDEAYMSAELEGVIPGSIVSSTYDCKLVHFQIQDRGWILVFENLHPSISVVGGPPGHHEREGQGCSGSGSWTSASVARSSPRRGAREGSRKVDGRRHDGDRQVPHRGGALDDRILGSVEGRLRAARRPLFSACWQLRQPAEPFVL